MKKIVTLLSVALLSGFTAFGQVEIRLFEGSAPVGNDISGTMVTVNVTDTVLVAKTFNVKNVSANSLGLNIERYRVTEVVNWTDGLCWGPNPDPNFEGHCYSAGQMLTNPWTNPHVSTIPPNAAGNLVVDIHNEGPGGCGLYRYYVVQGSTRIDSIDVMVCSTVGIDEQQEEVGMTAYPNPANNQLTVNTTGNGGNYVLRITDVLGKVVYTEEAGAVKKVDVSDFKNGVYLVTVLEKGNLIQTRRVVVKH